MLVNRRFIVAEATKVQEDACFEAIYSHYAAAEAWNVAPGAHAALTTIKDAGEVAHAFAQTSAPLQTRAFMWLLSFLGPDSSSAAHYMTHFIFSCLKRLHPLKAMLQTLAFIQLRKARLRQGH